MKYMAACLVMLGLGVIVASPAHAESLGIAPLEYRTTLTVGERQKGFVDITNPTERSSEVSVSVQAFRQINNKGDVQFYTNPEVASGIVPDYTDFELGPRQTIRLFFIIDGTKLPPGDVFAAILATTKPRGSLAGGVTQVIRVGTLLSIVNGTPGSRTATFTSLNVPFFQFGDGVVGSYVIKNTADPKKATGFYPVVKVTIDPLHIQRTSESSLIYAGNARTNDFSIQAARFGFYKITVSYGTNSRSQWIFMATGIWRLLSMAVACGVVAGLWWRTWYGRRRRSLNRSV